MRRSAQARIQAARHSVLGSTLSGLALMFDGVLAVESMRSHHRLRRQIFDRLLDTVADKILDIRPFRHDPRAVKRRPKPYQWLTAPRAVFREIPHKARYRKSTQN